jgi:gliding motility-associated-like protein
VKKLLYILLLFFSLSAWAQSISPQVLNAAGSQRPLGSSGITVTDNVGEPFTETLGPSNNLLLSQGFIQPEVILNPDFDLDVLVNDLTCNLKNDGSISTTLTTNAFKYDVQYIWTPTLVCPTNDCKSLDSLKTGTYSLSVIVNYTTVAQKSIQKTIKDTILVVKDLNGPCRAKVFTGITLNGDGVNDRLLIENISEFPNNRLSIYSRWGTLLYDTKGYNNRDKFWPSPDEADKLVAGTYFYILDIGDGSKPLKGWVEIMKN